MTKENLREPGDFVPFSGLRGFDFAVDLKIAGEVFDAFASVEEDKSLTPKDRARRGWDLCLCDPGTRGGLVALRKRLGDLGGG